MLVPRLLMRWKLFGWGVVWYGMILALRFGFIVEKRALSDQTLALMACAPIGIGLFLALCNWLIPTWIVYWLEARWNVFTAWLFAQPPGLGWGLLFLLFAYALVAQSAWISKTSELDQRDNAIYANHYTLTDIVMQHLASPPEHGPCRPLWNCKRHAAP